MDSRLVFLVAFVIASAVPYVKTDGNLTVLTYNFTRNDCGKTKLCVEKPTGCDPSNTSDCYFTSTLINAANMSLSIELSGNSNGNSSGYIAVAAGNNKNVSQGSNVVFICGNNNGIFFFQTATFKNNTLVQTTSPNVSNIQYSLKAQSLIQCAFNIPIDFKNSNSIEALTILGLNSTTFNISNLANETINVYLEVYQGSTNGTVLGQSKSAFGSSVPVNLANVNSSTVNLTTPTTNPNTTITNTTITNTTITNPNTTITNPNTTITNTTITNTTITNPNTTITNTTITNPNTTITNPNTTITNTTITNTTITNPNTTITNPNTTITNTTITNNNNTTITNNNNTTITNTTTTTTTIITTRATTKATTSGSTSFFNLMNHAVLALLAGIALRLL